MTAQEFLASLPTKVNPEALANIETVLHFDLKGATPYTVKVENGQLEVVEGLIGTPKCVVSTTPETLMKLVNREENAMMAMMTGKIKISNPGEMLKYAQMFGLM